MPWYSAESQLQAARRFPPTWRIALSTAGVGGAICIIGALLFVRGQTLMREQLRERLRSTAAAAAMQFDGDVIDGLRDEADMETDTFRDIVERLRLIRTEMPDIRYAYIMRQTDDPHTVTFVADADMLQSETELDVNGNGEVDPDEEPSGFGEEYDVSDVPALKLSAFTLPSVDEEVTIDRWGQLGLDMDAEQYVSLSQSIFSPIALLLVALAAVTIGSAVVLLGSRKQLEALHRIEAERSGLLRLAFHQLGGPLSIIKWSLELLHEDAPAAARQVLGNMDEGVKRLNNILHTLHEADLVHEGKVQYKAEEASLNEIVNGVLEEFGPHAERRKQKITAQLGAGSAMRLDRKLIAGVIRELLNNAIDFSFDGGEITIKTSVQGKWAQLEVSDRGCGIPKQDLPRLFAEFERGSNAATYKPDGSGLGLYIVRGIIERAGGRIWIKSREGQGTTVSFRLPIAR
jgi:signal transduction histidine kinase